MQDYEKLAAAIESRAAEWDASGCYAVIKDGETAFTRAFGYADRDKGIPMTTENRYCLPQHTPLLLTLCLLRLAEEKKLSLSDTLDRYIPEYRHGSSITLEQLSRFESGIPDYMSACIAVQLEQDPTHQARSEKERYIYECGQAAHGASFAEALAMVNDMALESDQGEEDEEKSGTSDIFLGEVISRVTGKTLFESERALVFEPLGMRVTEGDAADTSTAGCMRETERVPLAHGEARFVFTVDFSSLLRFGRALAEGELLSPAMWRKAQRFSRWGLGMGLEALNGVSGMFVSGPYGYSFSAGFSQKTRLCYLSVLSETQLIRKVDGEWDCFRPSTRREVEAFFQTYTAPRFVGVNESNVWMAMRLAVAPEQESFVLDAKSSVAACCGIRDWRPLVLMDQGRCVGLLVLNINKKKDIFEIAIVLIDRRFQGKGYGRFMLRYAVDELKKAGAKQLEIGVNRHNAVARHLYESVGFTAANVYDEGVQMRMEL